MKALLVCSGLGLALGVGFGLGFATLALPFFFFQEEPFFLKVGLFWSAINMAATCAFLDVTLCPLEHAAQLIQALFNPVHVVVQDEVSIARR